MVIDYFATKVDGVQMSCIQFFVAALFSAVCMLFTEGCPIPMLWPSPGCPFSTQVSCPLGWAYTLQIIGQKGVNPTAASLVLSLESVISVLAGWVILGQSMSPQRDSRVAFLMFCAIILAQLPDRKKRLSECTREA